MHPSHQTTRPPAPSLTVCIAASDTSLRGLGVDLSMEQTVEHAPRNTHVTPVLAAVLDCFQSPPTRAYRDAHPAHPGNNKLAESLLNGGTIPSATPEPTKPTILTPRYAPQPGDADVRPEQYDGVPQDVYGVGIPVKTSSPGEDAGQPGRTAAPALASWRVRCEIKPRKIGFDVLSPGGKYWLNMDGCIWCKVWDGMCLGAFGNHERARAALSDAPQPDDAYVGVTSTVYVKRPKDAGAIARQETSVRQAREAGDTQVAADARHAILSPRDRVIANEPSHYIGAVDGERLLREAEFARGKLVQATMLNMLALEATNLDVLREQIRREMMHREHLFSEINAAVKARTTPASAVVAA